MQRALKSRTIVVLLFVGIHAYADDSLPTNRISQLRREYVTADNYVERLIAASRLAHAGDYTYWKIVRKGAEKVVRHDRPRRLFRNFHVGPIHPIDPSNQLRSLPDPDTSNVYTEILDVSSRELNLDVWRIIAFATGARGQDVQLLRDALKSPRPMIAGNAALGLARLHDLSSVSAIESAAQNCLGSERLTFIEALVYMNDEYATRIAVGLASENPQILEALQELALQNHFDPFADVDD